MENKHKLIILSIVIITILLILVKYYYNKEFFYVLPEAPSDFTIDSCKGVSILNCNLSSDITKTNQLKTNLEATIANLKEIELYYIGIKDKIDILNGGTPSTTTSTTSTTTSSTSFDILSNISNDIDPKITKFSGINTDLLSKMSYIDKFNNTTLSIPNYNINLSSQTPPPSQTPSQTPPPSQTQSPSPSPSETPLPS
jgi:hypothetical protein